jgi:hypothetical protein
MVLVLGEEGQQLGWESFHPQKIFGLRKAGHENRAPNELSACWKPAIIGG